MGICCSKKKMDKNDYIQQISGQNADNNSSDQEKIEQNQNKIQLEIHLNNAQNSQPPNSEQKVIQSHQPIGISQTSSIKKEIPDSIIKISQKKYLDNDPAKHHQEVLECFEIVHKKFK